MSSDPFDDKSNLPPWLRDVPLPPRPRGMDEPTSPAATAQPSPPAVPPASVSLPDWLHETSAEPMGSASTPAPTQMSEQSGLPDWLLDMQPSQQPAAGAEQLPDWLKDLAGAETSLPQPPAPSPVPISPEPEVNLPERLRDTERGEEPPASAGQLPDWLTNEDEQPRAAEPSTAAGETPAWLNDLAGEPSSDEPAALPDWLSTQASAPPPAASSAEALPDWLRAEGGAAQPAETSSASPDWLRSGDIAGQGPSAGTPEIDLWGPDAPDAQTGPGAQRADRDVPAWLRAISADEADEDITAEPFSFEGAIGGPPNAEPAGSPAWLTGAEDITESVPDWLKDAAGQSEEQAGSGTPEVPLWLNDQVSTPAAEPAASEPTIQEPALSAPPPAADMPAWLQDAGTSKPPAEDIPDWLRDDQPAQPPAADVPAWLQDAGTSKPPAEDIPDWLRPAAAAEPPPSANISEAQEDTLPGFVGPEGAVPFDPSATAPSVEPPPSAGDDLPDWLRPAEAPSPFAPTSPESASGRGAEMPSDASRGQDLPPWLRDETGQPLPSAGMAGDTNLPAWLRGVPFESTPASTPAPAAQSAPPNLDWLEEAGRVESQRAPTAESEFFGGTELPAWLRPPEPEPPKEISPADARSLDWLTRLGSMEETETVTAVATVAPKLTPRAVPPRTPAQLEALALLERLAANPFPVPAPAPAAAQPSVLRRVGIERVLYFALLIVLLIGLAVPLPDSFGLATPPAAPGAAELFAQIDKLSEDDVVLVGYEWDARRSGELRPLEQAVLGHLIQRKVKLVLVSTDPQGTLLLFDFRDQLERAGYRKGGEDYILLGYRPGAELALRSFAQDFRAVLRSDFQGNNATISALATGADASKPRLANMSDFSAIMVLADEPQDVQGWMEQVHRAAKQVPFAFLLPAETAPLVQPYLTQPGIYHLAGKQGALAYQSLRGGGGLPAAQVGLQSGQQRLSLLIFIALFLVGGLTSGASAATRRGKRP